MIKIIWKPIELSQSQHSARWQTVKQFKDQSTSRFANALEYRINQDLIIDHDVKLIVSMKKTKDKFVWDFSMVPNSADGKEVIKYIKNRRFTNISGNFYY